MQKKKRGRGRPPHDDVLTPAEWRVTLGLKHLYTFGALAFFDCGGTRLMLTQQDGAAESVLYFRVADIRSQVKP
jgi:hypothetical protein